MTANFVVHKFIHGFALTALLMLLTAPVLAADPGCSNQHPESELPRRTSGQMAHVDPATGELVSESVDPLATTPSIAAPAVTDDTPAQVVRPDGTVVMDISGRFDQALVAEVVDGKLVTCHQSLPQDSR